MERWVFGRAVRSGIAALSLCVVAATLGCASETTTGDGDDNGGEGGAGQGGAPGVGGAGGAGGEGGGTGPCDQDCSTIVTPPCFKAVCQPSQQEGEPGVCAVVPDDGASCDDGLFCTLQDTCLNGQCQGGPQNDCEMVGDQCNEVTCNEATDSCSLGPAHENSPCIADDLCQVNGKCTQGQCIGTQKDCFFSPYNECNIVACNSATGVCEPSAPDPAKQGVACQQTGDPCQVSKTCDNGECAGGVPKDCSAAGSGCTLGVCEAATGACVGEPIPPGGTCPEATDECNVGICDASGTCMPTPTPGVDCLGAADACNTGLCDAAGACQPVPVADGTACNDYDSCTAGDTCTAGDCAGAPMSTCSVYLEDNFEGGCPPGGWTLGGDWECGTPSVVGPSAAYSGANCLGTQIDANYNNGQVFTTAIAQTSPVSLASATQPVLQFAAWVQTEASYDGMNIKVSTDGGTTWSIVNSVTPAYNTTGGGESIWGGTTVTGWQNYTVNLASYVGQTILVRFSFRSDGSVTYPGVYVDDVVISEANAIPLSITTASPLPGAVVNTPYSATLQKSGGTSSSVWSIVGGTNHGWLTINPTTGVISGTPGIPNLGAFSVTVHVEEPSLPSNFDEKTITGEVIQGIFAEGFEGACPNGWTLGGDWECGTPSAVGPATAYSGAQCLGTQIDSNYNNSQDWNVATATSPAISLASATNPVLTFRMWVSTEGSVYDGANLKISTDGVTFTQVMNVVPAYNLSSVGGQQAWGNNQSASGWQLVTVDLSAYAGQTIYLRYAFRSDSSVTYPGVYIDDLVIAD